MEIKVKETKSAGGVVLNKDGDILVISQHGSSWSLPKGHIEKGEDIVAAAKREIYEESGVSELELIKELGTYQRFKGNQNNKEEKTELKTITIFLFKTNQISLKPIDPDNPEARWVKKDEVVNLLTFLKDKEFFLRIKDKI